MKCLTCPQDNHSVAVHDCVEAMSDREDRAVEELLPDSRLYITMSLELDETKGFYF